MKSTKITLTLVVLLLAIFASCQAKKTLMNFKEFKEKFNKAYDSPEEEALRKATFLKNRKEIIQKVNCTTCGLTQFSDLTEEEF
jgi:hypothetical protein